MNVNDEVLNRNVSVLTNRNDPCPPKSKTAHLGKLPKNDHRVKTKVVTAKDMLTRMRN